MPAEPADTPLGQHEDRLVSTSAESSAADGELAEIARGAHTETLNYRARLERISNEIEQRVQQQDPTTVKSPVETSEFHQFLLAKQRQIVRILTEATSDAETLRQRLAGLNYPLDPPST